MTPYAVLDDITIGPLVIQTWGLLAALGFAAAILLAHVLAKRRGLSGDAVIDVALWGIIGAFVGARVAYVLNAWGEFAGDPIGIVRVWEGGLASWGGVAGFIVATLVVLRRQGAKRWVYLDLLALPAALGFAIGRIGCALVHDHLGRITNVTWGVDVYGITRHEPSYYLVIGNLIIFAILWSVWRRHRDRLPGFTLIAFLVLYGLNRLIFDTFRAADLPHVDPRIMGLTISQYFYLVQIAIGLGLFIYLKRKARTG